MKALTNDDAAVLRKLFFQVEGGIRDLTVTGVQTCALPIFLHSLSGSSAAAPPAVGTFLRGASSRDRSRTTLRLTLGCCRSSRHRLPQHPCSASLDSTP